jgi:hypothetical protein
MKSAEPQRAPLESKQRLSRSVVWKLQREYFAREGIEAWRSGTVPHHITTSPFIADAYARVVAGFLRDCLAVRNSSTFPALDPGAPLYFVELGSGSGRFAYVFLKKFLQLREDSVLKDIPVKYVMTDFAEQNLEYCRTHPWLQSLIEEGVVDFAQFDIEHDRTIKLMQTGEVLSSDNVQNPLVVIANYVFDSVPQDAFFAGEDQLFEALATTSTPTPADLEVSYDHNLLSEDYYDDPKWNCILEDYKQRLTNTAFLFPTAALECIRNLNGLSRGRMLLLSGDKGFTHDEALAQGKGMPVFTFHGSISMMVDYQVIGEYCKHLGARVLNPPRPAEHLNVSAFVFGDSPTGFLETRGAYAEAVEKFGPDDFFILKEGIAQVYDSLGLDEILAFIRLSCWDYKRFCEYLPALKKYLPVMTDQQKQRLHEAIGKVWECYLPIGEENDLAFELGTLLVEMELYAEALEFLQCSVALNGTAPGTAHNIAVCHYSLGQTEQALEYVDRALELDPAFEEARALRTTLVPAIK